MNMFRIKTYICLLIQGVLPTFLFFFFLFTGYGIILSMVAWMVMVIVGIFIYIIMIRHPLLSLIQGEGLLALTFDSTGVIEPFIIKVSPPFIKGKMRGGKTTESIFDRDTVFYTKNPKPATFQFDGDENEAGEKVENGAYKSFRLRYKKDDESKITYAFQQYPTFIFNKNLNAFLTKDALAKLETEGIIKHLVLYLKVKTEELTSIMRDFARYVIEMTRPKTSMFAGKMGWIIWIVIIAAIGLIVALFLPQIENLLGPAIQSGTQAIKTGVSTGAGTVKSPGG